jgi:hypothetical protein
MKSEVPSEPVTNGPADAAATEASRSPGGADAGDDGDFFKETPTAANRIEAIASAPVEENATPDGQRGGPGTYRILRPSTTDFVESPLVTQTQPPAGGKRLVIGTARKRG